MFQSGKKQSFSWGVLTDCKRSNSIFRSQITDYSLRFVLNNRAQWLETFMWLNLETGSHDQLWLWNVSITLQYDLLCFFSSLIIFAKQTTLHIPSKLYSLYQTFELLRDCNYSEWVWRQLSKSKYTIVKLTSSGTMTSGYLSSDRKLKRHQSRKASVSGRTVLLFLSVW